MEDFPSVEHAKAQPYFSWVIS